MYDVDDNQAMGQEAAIRMPHLPFPSPVLAMRMYPFNPQVAPQEFFTLKYFFPFSAPQPTANTPWSSLVPQLPEQTPLLQSWKERWLASMATETGFRATAALKASSLSAVTSVQSLIVQAFMSAVYLQVLPTPWQGYLSSVVIPLSLTQKKDKFMRPPLQPALPQDLEQSTNCCSEKDTIEPLVLAQTPSRDPVVEKAQQEPHCPWFLTPVTTLFSAQLTSSGRSVVGAWAPEHFEVTVSGYLMRYLAANSSVSMSANSFISRSKVSRPAWWR